MFIIEMMQLLKFYEKVLIQQSMFIIIPLLLKPQPNKCMALTSIAQIKGLRFFRAECF